MKPKPDRRGKPGFADRQGNFVTDGASSSTLRELRTHLGAPQVLAVLAGVALVLGFSGPFGTYQGLGLPLRLLYWSAVVFGTYTIGAAVIISIEDRWPRLRPVARVALGGAAIGVVVSALLIALGVVFFGVEDLRSAFLRTTAPGAFAVSWVVLALREVLRSDSGASRPALAEPAAPAILRRLPLDKRGALIALSAEDHYVAVSTARGRELLLMRLSDAIDGAEGVAGLQVHRSHWVALDQVRAAERQGDGAVLTLSDGQRIPVSRSRLPAVRDAGLLPG